jgi:hypothetical protein
MKNAPPPGRGVFCWAFLWGVFVGEDFLGEIFGSRFLAGARAQALAARCLASDYQDCGE